MNKVISNISENKNKVGNIYIDKENNYYLLVNLGKAGYAAVSFEHGNRWNTPKNNIEDAIENLTFVKSNAIINIS
jgi:hypothetical protein